MASLLKGLLLERKQRAAAKLFTLEFQMFNVPNTGCFEKNRWVRKLKFFVNSGGPQF